MTTPIEIRNFLNNLPELTKTLSYEKLSELCTQYFPSIPFPTVEFTNEPFFFHQREYSGMNIIYRGRKIENERNTPHQNVSDISYVQQKDIECIENFGRVNKKREPMFYGSLNAATASIETLSKGGEFLNKASAMLTMGVWKFETPLRFVELPYSEKYWKLLYDSVSFQSKFPTENHIKERNAQLKLQVGNDLAYDILMMFADAFANHDIKDDTDYYLSNYFADRVFNRIPGCSADDYDGIIYPSVINAYQESNIVLKPEVVNSKLKFIQGMQIWAVHFMKSSGGAQFNPIQQNIHADKDGKLLWRLGGT